MWVVYDIEKLENVLNKAYIEYKHFILFLNCFIWEQKGSAWPIFRLSPYVSMHA